MKSDKSYVFLYGAREITKKVYNNIMTLAKL